MGLNLKKLIIPAALVFFLLALLFAYLLIKQNAFNKLHQTLEKQLPQVINELKITLERHSYLPSLLSTSPIYIDFLKTPKEADEFTTKQSKVNLSLELTNNLSESSAIYIMRKDGTTVASSNWETPQSFIGKNFAFRPYFQQALQNVLGRYYAVGAISGERGYFFASAIHDNNKVIGVIAVKVAIDDIEFTWGQGIIDFMVTDPDGVIFLSSQKSWKLRSIAPLSDEQYGTLLNNRRYGVTPIKALPNTQIKINHDNFQTVKILNQSYEMLSKKMELANWDVRVIAHHNSIQKRLFSGMLISALILSLLTALGLLLWKTQQQRKKYQQQITEELENKVIERTKALKQTQEELIQAAKMAALGQLSAGITHEINNPLTAIRAYADNAKAFLQKDRLDMVESNLLEITNLTESMAAITRQLKSFARKSKGQIRPVLLGNAIDNALSIVKPKIISQKITCHWDKQQHGANKSVLADEVWLSQILVNLLSNAISATHDKDKPEIWISIKSNREAQLCVQISDNGVGIAETALPHIFEPFFTTKPSSKGLGLGLSISFNLAKDMNGILTVKNMKNGAQFTLCLPVVE